MLPTDRIETPHPMRQAFENLLIEGRVGPSEPALVLCVQWHQRQTSTRSGPLESLLLWMDGRTMIEQQVAKRRAMIADET